jgi:hypothetical protein
MADDIVNRFNWQLIAFSTGGFLFFSNQPQPVKQGFCRAGMKSTRGHKLSGERVFGHTKVPLQGCNL